MGGKANEADYVFITFILKYLPHGLIGLLVAAFFAAALSSKAAELNALGSTTTVDLYRHIIRREASDAHYVIASKCFTVFWGLVALSFALFANMVENLIQAANIVGSVFYGVPLALFLVAFLHSVHRRHRGILLGDHIAGAGIRALFYAEHQLSLVQFDRVRRLRVLACDSGYFRRPSVQLDMTASPVICFGQQPCGIFPKRFLLAEMQAARRLREQIGGEIVFFYHDSDHDPRETKTRLRHRKNDEPFDINFTFENKLQRKFSPLFLKRVMADWKAKTAMQLPAYVDRRWVEAFKTCEEKNVADFCLEMYRRMGLLEGIRVERSGDPNFGRRRARSPSFFVDVPYGAKSCAPAMSRRRIETTRRRGCLCYDSVAPFDKKQISPTPRHPAAMDAIGDSLHALRLRGRRTGLYEKRGCPGDHLRES